MSSIQSTRQQQLSQQLFTSNPMGAITKTGHKVQHKDLHMMNGNFVQKSCQMKLNGGAVKTSSFMGSSSSNGHNQQFRPQLDSKFPWPDNSFNLPSQLGVNYKQGQRVIIPKAPAQAKVTNQYRVRSSGQIMMLQNNIQPHQSFLGTQLGMPVYHGFMKTRRLAAVAQAQPSMSITRVEKDAKLQSNKQDAFEVNKIDSQKPLISDRNHMDAEFRKAREQVAQEFTGKQVSMLYKGIQFAVITMSLYSFFLYAEPAFSADMLPTSLSTTNHHINEIGTTIVQQNDIYGFDGIRDNMGVQDVAPELDLVETTGDPQSNTWLYAKFYGSTILFLANFLVLPFFFNTPLGEKEQFDQNRPY